MDSITFWKGAICLATLASFMHAALALATSNLTLWKASPFTFLLVSRAATMSWYFQPTSCPSLPREQNLLPCFSLRTFRADGMTMSFFLSYGGGTPSKVWSLLRASFPRSVLWGVMPRTVRQKFPLMLMPSHLTTTTLLPVRISLATMDESLPIRWPRPSTTIAFGDIPGIFSCRSESSNKSLIHFYKRRCREYLRRQLWWMVVATLWAGSHPSLPSLSSPATRLSLSGKSRIKVWGNKSSR